MNGNLIDILSDEFLHAGEHSTSWDASNMSNGVYFIVISDKTSIISEKIILLK